MFKLINCVLFSHFNGKVLQLYIALIVFELQFDRAYLIYLS